MAPASGEFGFTGLSKSGQPGRLLCVSYDFEEAVSKRRYQHFQIKNSKLKIQNALASPRGLLIRDPWGLLPGLVLFVSRGARGV